MAIRKLQLENAASLATSLDLIAELTMEDRETLRALPLRLVSVSADQDLVHEGNRTAESCLLLSGLLCRYKTVLSGQRQILSLHLPGEIPDLQSLYLEHMDHSVQALTPARVGYIAHTALEAAAQRSPSILAALWRSTLIDGSIFREWLAGVGRRTAAQRMAHLICELLLRMRMLRLATDWRFELPMARDELADALGLTPVHVSRTVSALRRHNLMSLTGRNVAIDNWKALARFADFDPAYLHYRKPIPEDLRTD